MNARLPVLDARLRYAGAGCVALAIAAASLAPVGGGDGLALFGVGADKFGHAAGYAALALALAYARLADRRKLVGVALVALGFGLAMELGQAPLATRAFSAPDLLANALGVGVGSSAWTVVARRSRFRRAGATGRQ